MDKEAGLFNTTIMLGPKRTTRVMYFTIAMAVLCLVGAIIARVFPIGLIIAVIFGFLISAQYRGQVDMRGGQAVDVSGAQQIRGLIVFNCIVFCWFIYEVANQMITVI